MKTNDSAVFSGGAGGARAPPEFRGSQKRQSLISAYQSLAITTKIPGFEKLNTALNDQICLPWIIMVAMNRITNTKRTIKIVILPLDIAIIDLIIKNTMTKKEIFVEH